MSFTGGKAGSGVYQTLINLMPPHETYIEPFLGGGAVMRYKRPALRNIGLDLDYDTLKAFDDEHGPEIRGRLIEVESYHPGDAAKLLLLHTDGVRYLEAGGIGAYLVEKGSTLVYLDPPYPLSVRSAKKSYYRHELLLQAEHRDLLKMVKTFKCMVMISTYKNPLYEKMLKGWRRVDFVTVNHRGRKVVESVYCNFDEALELHDYSFLGKDFRWRQHIKRKQARWIKKLEGMPSAERYAMLGVLQTMRDRRAAHIVTTGAPAVTGGKTK